MGGRYLITGAQIGVLKALTRGSKATCDLLDEIEESQFVWDSKISIHDDIVNLKTVLKIKM